MIVNQLGIPCIESTSVNLTATSETFSFNRSARTGNFSGLIVVKINQSVAAPTTAVPIEFVTNNVPNSNILVLDPNGTVMNTGTWPGEGIYLFFYDRNLNQLRMLTGVL